MAENKRGGARPGSGRKKTGLQTKHYTINLPMTVAEEMEKRAEEMNKTVNKYIRDIIEDSAKYLNVSIEGKHVDETSSETKGRYVDEIISEKSYVVIENGHEVHKTETHIRRWIPEEELKNEIIDEVGAYVVGKAN